MVTDFAIQDILDHLVKRIVDVMPISAAGVTLISRDSDPRYIAASDDSALGFERLQTELSEGPCLAAYETAEPVLIPDLRSDERFPRFAPRALEAGLRAVFTFPLRHGDSQLGALDLYDVTPGALSAHSMSAAQTLADVTAAYLLNAQARADLQESSDRSSEAALHDPLTRLPNRALMLERLKHAVLRARRANMTCAVLFVDLDRFKAVNDTYGHQVGDELLVAVADRLTKALRPGDTVARMSGDEFVILCEDLHTRDQGNTITARVAAALTPPYVLSGKEVNVIASIGIAFTGSAADAPEQLIHEADLAMYRAKRTISPRRRVLDLRSAAEQGGVARLLPGAAARGELRLVYQPIVATADGRLTGVEALLRWTHPHHGLVSPTVLIPLAEESHEIHEIGQWVLEQAWSDRQSWAAEQAGDLGVSVNVSAHQFMAAGFAEVIARMLDDASVNPRLLTLEVAEAVFALDEQRALVVLDDLKDIGVTLALDDFGTGSTSLSYLSTHPVDSLKVDRTFTAKLADELASGAIMTAVIQLAHGLGMTVCSKGVETVEQHHKLTHLGCDYCQGFYFAQPMPTSSLVTLLRDNGDGIGPRLPSAL